MIGQASNGGRDGRPAARLARLRARLGARLRARRPAGGPAIQAAARLGARLGARPGAAFPAALALALALLGAAPAPAAELPPPVDPAAFPDPNPEAERLGRLLFHDKILSGNRNLSCATCHHPRLGTSDGLSLGLGDGAAGLGPDRRALTGANAPERRIARNAPALWNLGAREFAVMFHDGRLEADAAMPHGMRTPLGADMASGFDGPLAAQAMFPVLSGDEMAGHYSENEVARAVRMGRLTGPDGAWSLIAARVAAIPAYAEAFARLDPSIEGPSDIAFADIANAIAAFVAAEFRADDSPFDRSLRGEAPLTGDAAAGMALFYGKAGCAACHSGPFQTDHAFHAIAMPQIGPGKAAPFEDHQRDLGRMRVTGDPRDAYRFRTPSLRNVELTAPYGHDGAYATLEGVIRHHLDPLAGLAGYDRAQATLPALEGARDWWALDRPEEMRAIAAANELAPVALTDREIGQLAAFLRSLTDAGAARGRLGAPAAVPSGLPVD